MTVSRDDGLHRDGANAIANHPRVAAALYQKDAPFIRADRPEWVAESAWRTLYENDVIVPVGERPATHCDDPRGTVLEYRLSEDAAEWIAANLDDLRDDVLCPHRGCKGTGFRTTASGYECLDCGRELSRDDIVAYNHRSRGDA